MRCSIQNLSFTYDGSSEAVFPGWSVELDTSWRLGLTGRNGRGKTTLLRLMMGELPHGGQISRRCSRCIFLTPSPTRRT